MSDVESTANNPTFAYHLLIHKKPITSIAFNPRKDQFATSSQDKSIVVGNFKGDKFYEFEGHTDSVTCVAYSPDGEYIVSASKDRSVRLWRPTLTGGTAEFKAHTSAVNTVQASPDNTKLVTGSNDKSLKLWDSSHPHAFIRSFKGHTNWVTSVSFSPLQDLIASCSSDRTVKLWDPRTGNELHSFRDAEGNGLAFHGNNKSLAVALSNGHVHVYDVRKLKVNQRYELHDVVTSVCWHPRANYFLSGGSDKTLKLVDAMEGRPRFTLGGHSGAVTACQFAPDGDYFAAGDAHNKILVWKMNGSVDCYF